MFASNIRSLIVLTIMTIALFSEYITGQEAPPPPFLQGASKDVVEDFKKLLSANSGKTDKQIDEAVDAWIEKQDNSIKVNLSLSNFK